MATSTAYKNAASKRASGGAGLGKPSKPKREGRPTGGAGLGKGGKPVRGHGGVENITHTMQPSVETETRTMQPTKTGGGKGAGTTPPKTTTTSTPVSPFLTPAQQLALNDWNTKYANDISSLEQNDVGALAKFNTDTANTIEKNAQDVNITDQSAAARGIFQSSIRDGALNDLAATLAKNENILHTNYSSTLLADQTKRTELVGQNSGEQTFFDAAAVTNAQNTPPDVTTGAGGGSGVVDKPDTETATHTMQPSTETVTRTMVPSGSTVNPGGYRQGAGGGRSSGGGGRSSGGAGVGPGGGKSGRPAPPSSGGAGLGMRLMAPNGSISGGSAMRAARIRAGGGR